LARRPAHEVEAFEAHMERLVSGLHKSKLYDTGCREGYHTRWKLVLRDVCPHPLPSGEILRMLGCAAVIDTLGISAK
jgi:hypothetical protein